MSKKMNNCKRGVSDEIKTQVRVSNNEVFGAFPLLRREMSSAWREAETVKMVIQSNSEVIKAKKVNVYCDNKKVQSVLMIGSRKEALKISSWR